MEGVNGFCFDGLDTKEARIEEFEIFSEEVGVGYIRCPMIMPIFVVEAVCVEAVNFLEKVSWFIEEFPEFGGGAVKMMS